MLNNYIDLENLRTASQDYGADPPFDHVVIDNFFVPEVAKALADEFPDFDSTVWHGYDNAIEIKKVCNNWNVFPPLTYSVVSALNSDEFLELLAQTILPSQRLYSDPGLNGGGWHSHRRGGKLDTHLDYSLHPKLGLQRKVNLIVYLNPDWEESWGGSLGFWDSQSVDAPGGLVKSLWCKFNRAVLFDTTQNSWHGLPEPLTCPEDKYRQSLATYYLTDPPPDVNSRGKALFAPTKSQEGDSEVLELIRKRAKVETAASVYKK